ncbi:MAG: hypothetical protein KDE59_07225, partial [Anaerolineales bacterium]|nr:hypothetical protein [Anaerolineales bacterium]
MAETQEPTPVEQRTRQMRLMQSQVVDTSNSLEALQTEVDRARGILGFGRRIMVPPDEIHVVVGHGRHALASAPQRAVFGSTAERPSRYWLNRNTRVIKLKTISFTVPIRGQGGGGVECLDSSKVSFRLWAHAVAKLNPDESEIAAQRVGLGTQGLLDTITEVGTAELVAAAATMTLEEIIADRQQLADIAFPKVNKILSELGYDLALLTITQLDGDAYIKLVRQAESRVSKETSIATNREQLAELQDDQGREQREAEVRAATEKKLASERLDAEREVESATIAQQEALDSRRHEMRLKQIQREKAAEEAGHEASVTKIQLGQERGEQETANEATIARLRAEKQAELAALQQQRQAEIKLAEARAATERMALEQERQIERAAALTEAEAERLKREELAQADRAKQVALLEASQLAESEALAAEAEAKALQIRVDAQTKTELVKAEAEATATEKRAQAAKIRAEATRAEAAAQGLAETNVEEARVAVAEKRVAVTRAEGLADAEVARAQAEAEAERERQLRTIDIEAKRKLKDVDINAQKQLADLYEQAPVLVELEKLRMQHEHEERLVTIQAEASLKAFEAIAPGVRVNIFGNGGQTGEIMSNLLSLGHGVGMLREEIPWVDNVLSRNGSAPNGGAQSAVAEQLRQFGPHLRTVLREVNPRMLSSLKVADVVDRLSG